MVHQNAREGATKARPTSQDTVCHTDGQAVNEPRRARPLRSVPPPLSSQADSIVAELPPPTELPPQFARVFKDAPRPATVARQPHDDTAPSGKTPKPPRPGRGPSSADPSSDGTGPTARPRIIVSTQTVEYSGRDRTTTITETPTPRLAQEGLDALMRSPWGARIFVRAHTDTIVHVVNPGDVSKHDDGRRREHARTVQTSKATLRGWLHDSAEWIREGCGQKGDEIRKSAPPDDAVAYLHDNPRGLRVLYGVTECPIMRRDGSILATPGFDDATGLYAAFSADDARAMLTELPSEPTHEDAQRARDVLFDLVRDFPFRSPEHRAAWLAGCLTMVTMQAFDGTAPLFMVNANSPGSGKSLLQELPFIITTGARPAMVSWSENPEEFRKAVTTEALAGSVSVPIDNITGEFRSAVLDKLLTSGQHRDRVLGGNSQFHGEFRAVWWANANNPDPSPDLAGRRTLPIELISKTDRPDEREEFSANGTEGETGADALRALARRDRWRYLAALLTIARAWQLAQLRGETMKLPPWGSFESWSRVVRGAVVYACGIDPSKTREEFRTVANNDHNTLVMMVKAWHAAQQEKAIQPDGMTLQRAVAAVIQSTNAPSSPDAPDGVSLAPGRALREALQEFTGERLEAWKPQTFNRVGRWLRDHRNKPARVVIDNIETRLAFDARSAHGGTNAWSVIPAEDIGKPADAI